MRIDQALAIAGRARIRRRIAAPSDNTAQEAPPSERPVALRDSRGRYLLGWAGGPGRPPRDFLREAYVDDLFAVWKRHGRQALRQVCQEDPALDAGEPQRAVARLLNVDQSTISRLAARLCREVSQRQTVARA